MGLILKIVGIVFMVAILVMTLTIMGGPIGFGIIKNALVLLAIGVGINGLILVAIGGIYSDLDHVIKLIKKEA